MATAMEHGVRLSQTSPEFLHANSTSHTWVYSAIAELIDNSYDANAKQMWIDKKVCHSNDCLVFMDDGIGMDGEELHRMLSFGYCDKLQNSANKPVGRYGNGFKSGSMRLGRDAIVFTKNGQTMSVGFLSQTYLKGIGAKTVLVPVVTWNQKTAVLCEAPHTKGSLRAITTFSPYKKTEDLLGEFSSMQCFQTGTRIIIYTLQRGQDNKLELDFDSNPTDIINSEREVVDEMAIRASRTFHVHRALYKKSLREYCSILFLRPRMKILLRGEKVKTKLIARSLSQTERDVYRPRWLLVTNGVKMTFGFTSGKDYGLMMYHKNRLIKPYEKIGYQKQGSEDGKGIVGVVRVDFLEPTHNKQDFNMTPEYNTFMNAIGMKLNDYWNTKMGIPGVQTAQKPDWTWVQCDSCLKWRRLPDHGLSEADLPDKWFCYMNTDSVHNRCEIPEEPEDEDELVQATYNKVKPKEQEKRNKVNALVKKEVELHHKEQELHNLEKKIKQQPAALTPVIEEAKASLIQAARREQDQLEYIRVLKRREKALLKQQEDLKRMAKLSSSAAAPKRGSTSEAPVALDSDEEQEQPTPGTSHQTEIGTSRMKKAPAPAPKLQVRFPPLPKRKAADKVVESNEDYVITQNDDKSDDDDVVIVEVEPKKRKVAEEADVKPDVDKLNASIKKEGTTSAQKQSAGDKVAPSSQVTPVVIAPSGQQPSAAAEKTNTATASAPEASPKEKTVQASAPNKAPTATETSSSGKKQTEKATESSEEDKKPDVDALGQHTEVTQSEATSSQEPAEKDTIASSAAAAPEKETSVPMDTDQVQVASASSSSDPTTSSSSSSGPASKSAATSQIARTSTAVQTDDVTESDKPPSCSCKQEVTQMKETLSSLRANVYKLLNVFVPELSLGSVDMIDTVVVEMIRVNSGSDNKTDIPDLTSISTSTQNASDVPDK